MNCYELLMYIVGGNVQSRGFHGVRSGNVEHPLQRHLGQFGLVWRHLDGVDDTALHQIFQYPGQVLRVDALHGRAHAGDVGHELDDLAVRQHFLGQAIDQIQFGADQPACSGRGLLDGLDDVFGRTDIIGVEANLEITFGVSDHFTFWVLLAEGVDLA
ncbi:MAG: hypothetical protein H6R18_272, partial [Proteobacteria bacterium]|nr:hypothetical protein [Pseudomonadota bacterium]